jgi:hypothetical protein
MILNIACMHVDVNYIIGESRYISRKEVGIRVEQGLLDTVS